MAKVLESLIAKGRRGTTTSWTERRRFGRFVHTCTEEEKRRQEYHQKVVDWANEPTPSEASFWVPLDLLAPKYAKLKVKARFCENIASHVKGLQIDDNDDGEYSENEVKEREEEAKATVDGYLNLLVNFGVVGALFISVLFGYAVNDLQLSAESIAFFGLIPVKVFKYLFLFCVNGSAVFSLYLIFRSVMLYKHLSFWMPDLVAQLEWVQNISITSTVIISQVVVFLVALALPFGAAAAISPIAGCISAIWVLLVFLYNRDTHFIEEQSELLLQKNTRRILQARKKSWFASLSLRFLKETRKDLHNNQERKQDLRVQQTTIMSTQFCD